MNRRLLIFTLFLSVAFSLSVESGGKLSREELAIDVKHYEIDIRIDPYKKTIMGQVSIRFELLEETNNIVLDLLEKYTVSGAAINGMSLSYKKRNNKLYIENPGLEIFSDHVLAIKYGGRPPEAKNPPWDGGVTWSRDSNDNHWVSVSCQTNGAHIWFPCKEHPSDKVEGADIIITAPEQLMVVSNGVLISKKKQRDRWIKWHWATDYPISTYNINFTMGDFELIEKTTYVLDKPLKMEFYVLPEKIAGANGLLNEAEKHVQYYARAFGQFPWIRERLGFVHTPFSGMEHQTNIAYGNNYEKTKLGYDFILFHELGHEWWGNFLSVADWSDFWIHEGICTYAEVMYVEDTYGPGATIKFVNERLRQNITNDAAIVQPPGGSAKASSGNDVYYKAAHVLHTLRHLIGKEVLRESLREYLVMPKDLVSNQTSTKEFISLINENFGTNIEWFFNEYLYSKDLPTLHIRERKRKDKRFVDIWWKNKGFKLPIEVSYLSIDGERTKRLEINNKPTRIVVPDSSGFKVDPNDWLLYDLKVIQ